MAQTTPNLTFWQRLCYGVLFGIMYAVSLLPLRVLYVLSTGCYGLIYHVVGYRRRLVRKHLEDSFPEKTEQDRRAIEQDFYRWFCDYIFETVKLFSMSKEEMRHRLIFKGAEVIDRLVEDGQGVALYLGHYCNWEWVSSIPLWLHGEKYAGAQVYHVLENPVMNQLLLYPRHRMGPENVAMQQVLRYIVQNSKEGRPVVMGFIADQVPYWNNIGHWMTFLNHPQTPVLTGTERLARRFNMAAVYIDLRRVGRGYYEAEFQLMSAQPGELPEFAMTEEYFHRLEASIRRQPHLWLWTHNRWKRTREEYDKMVDPRMGKLKM